MMFFAPLWLLWTAMMALSWPSGTAASAFEDMNNTTTTTNSNVGVFFGVVKFQMRSRSQTTRNDLLFNILSETGTFLDQTFSDNYKNTSYEFSHVTLSVREFSLENSEDGVYYAFVNVEGIAMFENGKSPMNKEKVRKIVNQALDDENTKFLRLLKSSDNPFLRDITFAIVTVDGSQEAAQSGGKSLPNTESDQQQDGSSSALKPWMIALVAAGTVAVLLISTFFICCCCKSCNQNYLLHAPSKPSVQTESHDSEDPDGNKGSRGSPKIPSPLYSITSQDSSRFTYNPNSNRSTGPITGGGASLVDGEDGGSSTGSNSKHSISFFGVSFHTQNSNVDVDVEAWQKGSTVKNDSLLPFGHDISAIDDSKRDLSLIEEGDHEDMTPRTNESGSTQKSGIKSGLPEPIRLSQHALAQMERHERRTRLNLDGPSAAVMDDLNDLSAQIDDYRRR